MLFNSYEFIFLFLPITFFVYFYLNKQRLTVAAKAWLVFASLFFYSWWNLIYLPLILGSMLFNFAIGTALGKGSIFKNRRKLLGVGITSNLLALGYFKYADFFINNINYWMPAGDIPSLNLALPLAISFFTFQQIAYLVDSYKGETGEYDFLNYAVFVSFFPQLIAGPIVHHKEMMPQFHNTKNKVVKYRNIAVGLFIFSIGLFKKVAIADTFAIWANAGFDGQEALTFFEAWATSLSYTFQLYFDFSGYMDMAMGSALLFNIRLPINFNSPYKALDIQDFWRRWHITLSRFLRDYIYIPLGGNKKGSVRTYTNLFTTFLIGGLWHGAGWTFVVWGGLHGIAMIIHRIWSSLGLKLWAWVAWLVTFNFVNITWVFFRAESFADAWRVIKAMFGMSASGIVLPGFLVRHLSFLEQKGIAFGEMMPVLGMGKAGEMMIVFAFVTVLLFTNSNEKMKKFQPSAWNAVYFSILFLAGFLMLSGKSEFLYFRF